MGDFERRGIIVFPLFVQMCISFFSELYLIARDTALATSSGAGGEVGAFSGALAKLKQIWTQSMCWLFGEHPELPELTSYGYVESIYTSTIDIQPGIRVQIVLLWQVFIVIPFII